eukprot:scaffold5063_cov127-Isochrysis_galbana.AAC.7
MSRGRGCPVCLTPQTEPPCPFSSPPFCCQARWSFRHSDHWRESSSESSATVCAVRARELPEPLINTVDDQAMPFANRSVGAILIYS